jgi:hypothetical protein
MFHQIRGDLSLMTLHREGKKRGRHLVGHF